MMRKKIVITEKSAKVHTADDAAPAPAAKHNAGEAAAPAQRRVIELHKLSAPKGAHKRKKLLGRGTSSGHGKTSTRGSKGQTSRAGRHFYLGFEGGQSPLIRRFPKRGFTNIFRKEYQIVKLSELNGIKESPITPEVLQARGLIKDKKKPVKILGNGELKKAVIVQAHAFSQRASTEIANAGGTVELINA